MRLLRRDPLPSEPAAAIERFWSWWSADGRGAVTSALADGEPARVLDLLAQAVDDIHPDLSWELAAGSASAHALVVSAEGDPALRALAARWLRAAPAADREWEFADARLPVADVNGVELDLDGHRVAFRDIRVGAHRTATHIDVALHHPVFRELEEDLRSQVAFLALDAALGERDVEAWVGSVTTSQEPPLEGFGLAGLRAAVRDLKDDNTAADGTPSWVALEGEDADGPVLAFAQVPLSPTTAPHLDTHVAVLVPYTDLTEQGFPGPGSLTALRALEDHLAERIGNSGRVVAHQSHRGMRVLHIYVDSTTPAVEQMRAAVEAWDQGRIRVQVTADPGWHNVAHLRS